MRQIYVQQPRPHNKKCGVVVGVLFLALLAAVWLAWRNAKLINCDEVRFEDDRTEICILRLHHYE